LGDGRAAPKIRCTPVRRPGLGDNRIGTAGAEALATTEALPRLIGLALDQNQIEPLGVEALDGSPWLVSHRYQQTA